MLRRITQLALGSLALLALVIGGSTAARADAVIDAVADILRAEFVYNDPSAENSLSATQEASLRDQITATGLPIYIAVLPQADADEYGSPEALLTALRDAVGENGVYAVVAGNAFRAGSTSGSVREVADTAFAQHSADGVYPVLTAFVSGVDEQYSASGSTSGSTSGSSAAPTPPSSSGSGIPILIPLLVIVVLGGVGFFFLRRRSKKVGAERLAAIQSVLDEDVTALGEQLGSFDITDPRLDDAGRADLQKALDSYSSASDAAATVRSDRDVTAATSALEEGRYSLACVQARMAGEPPPAHRAPCFVDPRHGPSVDDIPWAPQGGTAHPIPVCAACEVTIRSGGSPEPRRVESGGQRVPYWQAGTAYAPYARGYYSTWSDVLPALFIGTMMASAFSAPAAQAAPLPQEQNFGGGDFGGNFGGGGGNFGGGGDFGGGDF